MSLYDEIMEMSRQASTGGLSPWFDGRLTAQIDQGHFLDGDQLDDVLARLLRQLVQYRDQAGVRTAVLGMSGGVDSALTAALFKQAGWRVIGFTLPIRQDPEESERGIEACEALGLEHVHLDLTPQYESMVGAIGQIDPPLSDSDEEAARTRRGNLRARLRMMTLYDQAHRFGGLVASTDNFSELGAGFWTLHGDVGDLAPVQGLTKSWEVPWLARAVGVPERTWRAKPTDGLGIGAGDEAQIGATYLEWDIALFALHAALERNPRLDASELVASLGIEEDGHARGVLETMVTRLQRTWHKRVNPIRLEHPLRDRFGQMDAIDESLFRPPVLRRRTTQLTLPTDLHAAAAGLCERLSGRKMRLVTAESCTGGLLAACLAAVPGSSAYLEGSFVTYRTSMKIEALGVSEALVAERTVYDPEVARRMAAGALDAATQADLALAVTGVAGPDADQGVAAGYVCIAACLRGQPPQVCEFNFDGDPAAVLAKSIAEALAMGCAELDAHSAGTAS